MATDLGTLRAELAALRDEVRDALAFEAGRLRAELDAKADRSTSYPLGFVRGSKIIQFSNYKDMEDSFLPFFIYF